MIAQADRDHTAQQTGAASTSAWVATTTHSGSAAASAQVTLATALADELPVTREALAQGSVSTAAASIIADTMRHLPDDLTPEERTRVEEHLVEDAQHLDPARLRKRATLALADAGRSAVEAADHQEAVLEEQKRRAYNASRLTLHDNPDGTTTGRFTVPHSAGAILRKILQSMTAPRRDQQHTPGEAPADEGSSAADAVRARNTDWNHLDWQDKRGRAFVELLEHLPTDQLTGTVAATIVVTMTLDQAMGAAAAAATGVSDQITTGATTIDTGHHLTPSQARRLACHAGILPAVLDGASLPLDLGRRKRLYTNHQRTALATVYDECAALGCDRPYSWTELHHQHPWARGGSTDLKDAIPLCGHHHRRMHDSIVDARIHTDARGKKTVSFTPRR